MHCFVLFLAVFVACAHETPTDDACSGLARSFHALASNKDLGLSLEDQVALLQKSDPPLNPEVDRYLRGMLSIIYEHPDLDAERIRESVLAVCVTDAAGRIQLPPAWDPWRHAA